MNARAAKISIALATLTAVLAIAPAAQAAPDWANENPPSSPSARQGAAMAYDATNQEMVLFGGRSEQGALLGDTWTWDGTNWTLEQPASSPTPRTTANMAFDESTGQMLLIGGQPGAGQTWNWDGSTWTQLSPETPAPSVQIPSVAYDPGTEAVLLFGGIINSNQNATWSWNGTTWTQLMPQTSPSPRWGAPMAYDPVNEEMVLFGGVGENTGFQDTWTWNGTDWTQESPATSPSASFGAPMAFSPLAGSVIKPSGQDPLTGDFETWGWDGTDWARVSTFVSPPARVDDSMALDEARNELVMFGGFTMEGPYLDDTWTFGNQTYPPPTATISSPPDGETFEQGEVIDAEFTCAAAVDAPAVQSCLGENGKPSGSTLDTSSIGAHSFTVTATAVNGQTGSATIDYTVVKKTPPDPPACKKVRGLTLGTFGLVPPLGDAPPVPGVRVRLGSRGDVVAKITPYVSFAYRGWAMSVNLKPRTIRIDGSRKLRFRIPARAQRAMLREKARRGESGPVYGTSVIFGFGSSLKARGDRSSCFRDRGNRTIRLEVVNVSSRVALRRR